MSACLCTHSDNFTGVHKVFAQIYLLTTSLLRVFVEDYFGPQTEKNMLHHRKHSPIQPALEKDVNVNKFNNDWKCRFQKALQT